MDRKKSKRNASLSPSHFQLIRPKVENTRYTMKEKIGSTRPWCCLLSISTSAPYVATRFPLHKAWYPPLREKEFHSMLPWVGVPRDTWHLMKLDMEIHRDLPVSDPAPGTSKMATKHVIHELPVILLRQSQVDAGLLRGAAWIPDA